MKKLITLIIFGLFAHSAFAYDCTVLLLDSQDYIVQTYHGYSNNRGLCRDQLRDCNYDMRTTNTRGVRCETSRTYYPGSGRYTPGGNTYNTNIVRLLSLSNYQLANEAYSHRVGICTVSPGNSRSACDYYVNIGNRGFANGTGCARSVYTYNFGCNYSDEFTNAGCLIRYSLERGQCF